MEDETNKHAVDATSSTQSRSVRQLRQGSSLTKKWETTYTRLGALQKSLSQSLVNQLSNESERLVIRGQTE
jgi:hypothetical protein